MSEAEWAPMDGTPDFQSSIASSPPASPTPFAPTGRPLVRARFRNTNRLELAEEPQAQAQPLTLQSLKKSCSVCSKPAVVEAQKLGAVAPVVHRMELIWN